MQHKAATARNRTCCIRRAAADDAHQIARLIRSSSIHAGGLKRKRASGAPDPGGRRRGIQSALFKINFALFSSRVEWRNYAVALSPEGSVVGCCQVKTRRCGTREVDTLCVDRAWRSGTVAARLMRFVIENNPHPLWGTCPDNVVAFQKRNGGTVVTDPCLMPPFLRRRQRLFNFLLRLARKKTRLAVMMLDEAPSAGRRRTGTKACSPRSDPAALRTALLQRIRKYQHGRSRPFRCLGLYETVQGLFVSYATYTFSLSRRFFFKDLHYRLPDNNAFVTFWTLELLLEACAHSSETFDEPRVQAAIGALMEFHDHTRAKDDPLFMFWRQRQAGGHLVSCPSNLMPLCRLLTILDSVRRKLIHAVSKIIPPAGGRDGHPSHAPPTTAFSLPADLDDAALNWSLGSCLYGVREAYPDAWAAWSQNAFDFRKLARHALACAYRPFDQNRNANTIDPRSFYASREFLWDLQDSGRDVGKFSLLTTWASTTGENREGIYRYYKMPFNVNNIDCSVQANFIHAACRSALNGTFPHDVEHFDDLIINTAQYLAWAVASGTIIHRPDIALLYYPTPFCAFLIISRIVHLLHHGGEQGPGAQLLAKLETVLAAAARQHITDYILSCAVRTPAAAFWQRPSAQTQSSSPRRAVLDDRKFLTAVSVLCLLNLWTRQRGTALEWLPSVPDAAAALAGRGLAWLRREALSGSCPDHNAFFSASVKHRRSLPFMFPANLVQHSEGPALQPGTTTYKTIRHSVYAMSGVPSREEYARMLREKGLDTLDDGTFQKCYELDYPYWSAPSVTSALTVLALSKAEKLSM